MKALPPELEMYKKTKTFSEKTVPQALLNNHNTKPGTWGKIVVTSGELIYTIQSEPQEEHILNSLNFGVVEPEVLHRVTPLGDVEFYVEFYR